jgi:hypothetical protein
MGFFAYPLEKVYSKNCFGRNSQIGCFRLSPFLLVLLLKVYVREVQIDFGR